MCFNINKIAKTNIFSILLKITQLVGFSAKDDEYSSVKWVIFVIFNICLYIFPLGILFGIIALVQIKESGDKGKGLAIAGIVISALVPIIYFMLIGFMAYFGVLNPKKLLPPQCTISAAMPCRDYRVSSTNNEISLKLTNSFDKPIVITF